MNQTVKLDGNQTQILKSIVGGRKKDNQHPTLELVLNSKQVDNKNIIVDPSLLVLDKKTKVARNINNLDGLLYQFVTRRAINEEGAMNAEVQDQIDIIQRKVRMLICVTVYSETVYDLERTLDGIYKNLKLFREHNISNQDIGVVVIFDGCEKVDPTMLSLFNELDQSYEIPYQDRLLTRIFQFKEEKVKSNSVFLYQVSHQVEEDSVRLNDNFGTLTVFFAVKLPNAGKLSSHMWFFRGFCYLLQPFYCTLIDCGTMPADDSIFNLFKALEGDKQLGGVCGYMGLTTESIYQEGMREDARYYDQYDFITKTMLRTLNIQKTQKFEYSFSHIVDKSFESLIGFVSVLPGAFSAYRWDALTSRRTYWHGQTILDKNIIDDEYLISILDPNFKDSDHFDITTANKFLAEDRILCLEIFTKKNYILKYIPNAKCYTDPVKYFILLLKQRKRWINGSWFALNYVLQNFSKKVGKSNHSFIRVILFYFSMLYAKLGQFNIYLVFSFYFTLLKFSAHEILAEYYISSIGPYASLESLVILIYIICMELLFHFSLLCNQPEEKVYEIHLISTILGFFLLVSFGFFIFLVVGLFFLEENLNKSELQDMINQNKEQIKYLVLINIGFYVVPCLLQIRKTINDMLWNTLDFLYYSPAYVHTILIWAFCHVDDLSWGTKGQDSEHIDSKSYEKQVLKKQQFEEYKITFVGKWRVINVIFTFVLVILTSNNAFRNFFILLMAYYFTAILGVRSVCAIIYTIKFYLIDLQYYNYNIKKKKNNQYKRELKEYQENVKKDQNPQNKQGSLDGLNSQNKAGNNQKNSFGNFV